MASVDLRECLNAISDVVINRPRPLRAFDQIYMKVADMLLQTEHVGRHFSGKDVVFIGDGDAIGLCLVHLHQKGLLPLGPKTVTVLDFDERVVNSVNRFAEAYGIQSRVSAASYNVRDPLPPEYLASFDGFYTNPPFGQSNGGASVRAFVRRGMEASRLSDVVGCVVIADYQDAIWTQNVLQSTQVFILESGFAIYEQTPRLHRYHLDDAPDLFSCSIVARSVGERAKSTSHQLSKEEEANFYGMNKPLEARRVIDLSEKDEQLNRFEVSKYP